MDREYARPLDAPAPTVWPTGCMRRRVAMSWSSAIRPIPAEISSSGDRAARRACLGFRLRGVRERPPAGRAARGWLERL